MKARYVFKILGITIFSLLLLNSLVMAQIHYDSTGNVGIGTTSPHSKLHVMIPPEDNNTIILDLEKGNDSFVMLKNNGDLIVDNGNVGIGITNPEFKLHVDGDIFATGTVYGSSGTADTDWIESGGNIYRNSGNVGIGTTSPSEMLDVNGAVKATAFNLNGDTITSWPNGSGEGDGHSLDAADGDPVDVVYVDNSGNVGIDTKSPEAKLHITTDAGDGKAFIRASNFNPVPTAYWPYFDKTAPYLLKDALWVGWDDTKKAWKYTKESDNDRGVTDPGDPAAWVVNGKDTGYFDGDLDTLPPGTHINNRYNPKMMAYRCNQDDIQVKVGSFWMDKYACRIIDVGSGYTGTTWKDDTADMTTSANENVPPYWMAFSQRARASTSMTWFVAAQAAVNAGKRLPSNAEWQASALGTARSSGNDNEGGSNWSTVDKQDVSRYGLVGMAGNVAEWVADWIQAGTTWQSGPNVEDAYPWPSGKGYGDDVTHNINGRAHNGSFWDYGVPAALVRGCGWFDDQGSDPGVFAVYANYAPSSLNRFIGFRSAR